MTGLGWHGRVGHIYFPNHRSLRRCRDRLCLGTLQFLHIFVRETLAQQGRFLGTLQVGLETFAGHARLIVAILAVVHSQLEQFFFVFAHVPAVLFHLLAVLVQLVGIVRLWIGIGKLVVVLPGQFHDFRIQLARQTSALAQNHAPRVVVDHRPALFALHLRHDIHQRHILHILAEGGHQWRITQLGPYVFHLVEQHHQQVVDAQFRFALAFQYQVDAGMHAFQVGHHRAHHSARQSALQQQRRHVLVARIHEVAQEVVDELLRQRAGFHVGLHVDVGHLESLVAQHGLHRDNVGMHLSPRHGFHRHVDDVGSVLAHFQDGGHRQSRTAMAVILDDDIRMFVLDGFCQTSQHARTSDACHVLQTDFGSTRLDQLVGNGRVIFHGMYGRMGDTKRSLGNHACLKRILDGRDDVARFVQSAEDTGDVHPLGMLHLIHQPAYVGRHRIHAQCIQSAVQHVCLYACLPERFGKGTHGLIRILTIKQVHLFESAAIGLNAGKASHFYNYRSNADQLVHPWLVLSGRLPHVTIDKTEFNLLFHNGRGIKGIICSVNLT